jgi:hypothetical protein
MRLPRIRKDRQKEKLFLFEHHTHPLLSRAEFLLRLVRHVSIGLMLIVVSLIAGMLGYHHFEHMPWIDAYTNASMILSGMGPVSPLQTDAGKIFAGTYALFSGLALLTIVGIVFAPVAHRFFHKFHLESHLAEQEHDPPTRRQHRS